MVRGGTWDNQTDAFFITAKQGSKSIPKFPDFSLNIINSSDQKAIRTGGMTTSKFLTPNLPKIAGDKASKPSAATVCSLISAI